MGEAVKVSIVVAILNSPEVVRRQVLHFKKMDLPDDVEIIFVDDGSDPPLEWDESLKNYTLLYTHDKREWTQPAARNRGIKYSKGEYLLLTDIDHILTRELIEAVRETDYDVVRFRRKPAVLDEKGAFSVDEQILRRYGLLPKYDKKLPAHGNSFAIRKELYLRLGGVSERLVGTGKYPNREEQTLKARIKHERLKHGLRVWDDESRPIIYMFPNGKYCGSRDYNPFGLFHTLSREKWWKQDKWLRDLAS